MAIEYYIRKKGSDKNLSTHETSAQATKVLQAYLHPEAYAVFYSQDAIKKYQELS